MKQIYDENPIERYAEGLKMSAEDFCIAFRQKKFYKVTDEKEEANGLTFQTGYNAESVRFAKNGKCLTEGIWFSSFADSGQHRVYEGDEYWVREVTFVEGSTIIIKKTGYVTDKLILGERCTMKEFYNKQKYEDLIQYLMQCPYAIRYVENKTHELCMMVVKLMGITLEHIEDQTKELCMAAVSKNGLALQYVKDQTFDICLAAVQQNGLALEYVILQKFAIRLAAVQQNGLALKYVNKQKLDICRAAYIQNPESIEYMNKKYTENKEYFEFIQYGKSL